MLKYSVFLDNGTFEEGTLHQHLEYLRTYGGTPDSWVNTDCLQTAINDADSWVKINTFVTDADYNIIYTSLKR